MKFAAALLVASASPALGGSESSQGVGNAAVQKVIQMLTDMSAKAQKEKQDEEVAFAKFETWCKMEVPNVKTDITKGEEEIEDLTSEIEKLGSDIKGLVKDIKGLRSDVEDDEAELKKKKAQRAEDHAAFVLEEKDFSESVDAVDRALKVLSEQNYDRPGAAAALIQVASLQRLPEEARSIATAFIGMLDGDTSDAAVPEANAYEFQSGGIIDMLKKLRDEFREKLATCQKEEMNAASAHEMIALDLNTSIKNANRDADEKASLKERKTSRKAEAKKQKDGAISVKAENEKLLKEMTTECKEKSFSFKEKQQLRAEEIEAIAKATEILQSPDVAGNSEKHLSLVQTSATSLVQAAIGAKLVGQQQRLQDFLSTEGKRLHSQRISMLAVQIAADPFAKVKKMIDTMITRLEEEANEDAKHEGFCDEEMGKSKVTRNKLTEDIDALSAAIEEGKATVMKLTEDTEELTNEVADLEKAMGEASELRKAEKAKNKETVEDAKAGSAAVARATAVLKDFYEKAAMATGFLQSGGKGQSASPRIRMGTDEWEALANPNFEGTVDKGHKDGMQTFGGKETGQQGRATGVLALLEVCASDFANLAADTEASEAASAEAFERFMVESKKNKAVKNRKIEMNTADKASTESKIQEDTADLKTTQDELLAAERYHKRLVPQCIDQGMTWEERVAAREAEIASLKEALTILNSPDVA